MKTGRPVKDIRESVGTEIASMLVLFIAMCLVYFLVNVVFRVDLLEWTSSLFRKHGT